MFDWYSYWWGLGIGLGGCLWSATLGSTTWSSGSHAHTSGQSSFHTYPVTCTNISSLFFILNWKSGVFFVWILNQIKCLEIHFREFFSQVKKKFWPHNLKKKNILIIWLGSNNVQIKIILLTDPLSKDNIILPQQCVAWASWLAWALHLAGWSPGELSWTCAP